MHNSHQRPVYHSLPPQKRSRTQFQSLNTGNIFTNQVSNNSLFMPKQQFVSFQEQNQAQLTPLEPTNHNFTTKSVPVVPATITAMSSPMPIVQGHCAYMNTIRPNPIPVMQSHAPSTNISMSNSTPVVQCNVEAMNTIRPNPIPATSFVMQSHATTTNNSMSNSTPVVQCNVAAMNTIKPNPIPATSFVRQNPIPVPWQPLPVHKVPNSFLNIQGGAFLPQPSNFPPASQQGLISLTNQTPVQESIGLEFDAAKLKVRHESVINALYSDLPRQCTSCGHRFKYQEEHSRHMDWHVVRNRATKSQKQKQISSRKWFANPSLWLVGAEASATEAFFPKFFTSETVAKEEVEEELLTVIADEDQKICALCHEPFEDFFSDEADDWLYKGAVYLKAAPKGSIAGIDRSQLGPIVHAKCRPESSVVSSNDVSQTRGIIKESNQRKRM